MSPAFPLSRLLDTHSNSSFSYVKHDHGVGIHMDLCLIKSDASWYALRFFFISVFLKAFLKKKKNAHHVRKTELK